MENQLITAEKVIAIAFSGCDYTPTEMVTDASIASAQRRYLLPVLGEELIEALLSGDYEELLTEYVEPTMAMYTRLEMTPDEDSLRKSVLRQARSLARRLSDHLEENESLYSEYRSENNVLRRIRIYGTSIEYR